MNLTAIPEGFRVPFSQQHTATRLTPSLLASCDCDKASFFRRVVTCLGSIVSKANKTPDRLSSGFFATGLDPRATYSPGMDMAPNQTLDIPKDDHLWRFPEDLLNLMAVDLVRITPMKGSVHLLCAIKVSTHLLPTLPYDIYDIYDRRVGLGRIGRICRTSSDCKPALHRSHSRPFLDPERRQAMFRQHA